MTTQHVETLIVGAGQAGLAVGYHLQHRRRQFLIVDADERIGDSWRKRWPTLRLYSPARVDGLPGMPFPARPHSFPTASEMAEYLEAVTRHWERLKVVVAEDVEIYREVSAARRSSAYTKNRFNDHECKITHFHAVVQQMLDA